MTLAGFRCGPSDPTFRFEDATVWRALRTAEGDATVRVTSRGARAIEVRAWGPGRHDALRSMPCMLGFEDDDRDFVAHHEVIRRAHRRYCGARLGRGGALIETLVATVIEQKVTSFEAHRSWRALVQRHGQLAPGPQPWAAAPLWVAPSPATLAHMPYPEWHGLGIERRRADAIRRLCARAPKLEALASGDPSEARRVLEHFPGVGPWTSNTVTLRAMGDRDAVVVGDYHLPHIVAYTLTGHRRGTDAEMLELLEPYRGQRARAMRLLVLAGRRPPRRVPRARVRDFRSF
jgi:3-methyladenine DNA glycosylase/8-oxoguanine DNA glycosylase